MRKAGRERVGKGEKIYPSEIREGVGEKIRGRVRWEEEKLKRVGMKEGENEREEKGENMRCKR